MHKGIDSMRILRDLVGSLFFLASMLILIMVFLFGLGSQYGIDGQLVFVVVALNFSVWALLFSVGGLSGVPGQLQDLYVINEEQKRRLDAIAQQTRAQPQDPRRVELPPPPQDE